MAVNSLLVKITLLKEPANWTHLKNVKPGLKSSIQVENFKLDQKFQFQSFSFRGPAGVQKRARSNISIHDRSLELSTPKDAIESF